MQLCGKILGTTVPLPKTLGRYRVFFVERTPFRRHANYVSLTKSTVANVLIPTPIEIDCGLSKLST